MHILHLQKLPNIPGHSLDPIQKICPSDVCGPIFWIRSGPRPYLLNTDSSAAPTSEQVSGRLNEEVNDGMNA